jgi:hypothetical protein
MKERPEPDARAALGGHEDLKTWLERTSGPPRDVDEWLTQKNAR